LAWSTRATGYDPQASISAFFEKIQAQEKKKREHSQGLASHPQKRRTDSSIAGKRLATCCLEKGPVQVSTSEFDDVEGAARIYSRIAEGQRTLR